MRVINPGFYSTIQDLGRFGYQQYGMPVSGAMDEFALRVGNILVGNPENSSSLEFTYAGLSVEFQSSTYISITGGNYVVLTSQGKVIDCWKTVYIEKETIVTIKEVSRGCRGYISVFGGFDIPQIMGSASTYIRGKVGGFKGRLLQKDDEIAYKSPVKPLSNGYVPAQLLEKWYKKDSPIRVILGPQIHAFTGDGIGTFLLSEYTIAADSDRMGYRLDVPPIEHKDGPDIISDGIAVGSIQVPGSGTPIIMQADRQTTGGYTKIATVATVDLPRLAQMVPGDIITFKDISVNRAHDLLKDFNSDINFIKGICSNPHVKYYSIKVNGDNFKVSVEEVQTFG
jgi:biotin-dependent carboxylase-like uncharacterized protein